MGTYTLGLTQSLKGKQEGDLSGDKHIHLSVGCGSGIGGGGREVERDHFSKPPEPRPQSSQQAWTTGLLCTWAALERRPGAQGRDAAARAHLGALDVVVQVVPERVDQVDGIVSSAGVGVAREQH